MTSFELWDAIFLVPTSLIYLGWLYLPYRHAVDRVPVSAFWSPGKVAAILVAASIYGLILFLDWKPAYKGRFSWVAWVGYTVVAWRAWPLFGAPLWALAVVLFPHIIRRRFAPKPFFIEPLPDSLFALPGWILFAYSYLSLLIYLDL